MFDEKLFKSEVIKASINPEVDILVDSVEGKTLLNPDNLAKLVNDIRENLWDMVKLVNININAEVPSIDQDKLTNEQIKALNFCMLASIINGEENVLALLQKEISTPFVARERYLRANGLNAQFARIYVNSIFDTYLRISQHFKTLDGEWEAL